MDVSVVCPFYNESKLIRRNVLKMLESLRDLPVSWELIVVNDGSTDDSLAIVESIAAAHTKLRVITYNVNRGRGHALRTGISAARGAIIVTTEIDLSWGSSIVHDLYGAFQRMPDADVIVASPHLPGGGYRHVPPSRVLLSRIGNRIIRACMSNEVTMNTGMTRGYRRSVIQAIPLFEDSKEFHLEVVLKAHALGLRIREIPAVLEWPEERRNQGEKRGIRSSSVNRFIVTHSLFSLFGNPIRYIWAMSLGTFTIGAAFLFTAFVLFLTNIVSIYTALFGLSLMLLAIVMFLFGVVVKQGNMVQREIWLMQFHHRVRMAEPVDMVRAVPVGTSDPRMAFDVAMADHSDS